MHCLQLGHYGGVHDEIDTLKRDKNVLMLELVRLRQQQQVRMQGKIRHICWELQLLRFRGIARVTHSLQTWTAMQHCPNVSALAIFIIYFQAVDVAAAVSQRVSDWDRSVCAVLTCLYPAADHRPADPRDAGAFGDHRRPSEHHHRVSGACGAESYSPAADGVSGTECRIASDQQQKWR